MPTTDSPIHKRKFTKSEHLPNGVCLDASSSLTGPADKPSAKRPSAAIMSPETGQMPNSVGVHTALNSDTAKFRAADDRSMPSTSSINLTRTRPHELSMEEKLKQMNATDDLSPEGPMTEPVKTPQSLAVALVRGLHSQDKHMLEEVFGCTDPALMRKVIEQVPVHSVIPLIRQLELRFKSKTNLLNLVLWLKTTVETHLSFLASHPDIVSELSGVYQLIEVRTSLLDKVLKLQGKLDVLVRRAEVESSVPSVGAQPAKTVFQEESSDEEQFATRHSGEDEWDELDLAANDESDQSSEASDSEDAEEMEESDEDELEEEAAGPSRGKRTEDELENENPSDSSDDGGSLPRNEDDELEDEPGHSSPPRQRIKRARRGV